MEIEDGDHTVAKVMLITPLRERFDVKVEGGDLEVKGNIVDHEYKIRRG
jgi:uncharacterized protein YxjI